MEFITKKLEFTYDGKKQSMAFPTVGQVEDFVSETEKIEEEKGLSDTLGPVLSFCEKLGLPKEDAKAMQFEHLTEIVQVLTGQKKS